MEQLLQKKQKRREQSNPKIRALPKARPSLTLSSTEEDEPAQTGGKVCGGDNVKIFL